MKFTTLLVWKFIIRYVPSHPSLLRPPHAFFSHSLFLLSRSLEQLVCPKWDPFLLHLIVTRKKRRICWNCLMLSFPCVYWFLFCCGFCFFCTGEGEFGFHLKWWVMFSCHTCNNTLHIQSYRSRKSTTSCNQKPPSGTVTRFHLKTPLLCVFHLSSAPKRLKKHWWKWRLLGTV